MNKLVSIIIPVYNSEKYLKECISSFLAQTYSNIELILIDDGSSDNSFEIMKKYREKYGKKFLIYTQENQGIAKTRNRGIQYANGTYIMFSDNDDYVENDYVETLVKEIEKDNADMVVCSCRKVDEKHNTIYEQKLTKDEWSRFRLIAPWARIIKKDFIVQKQLEFGEFKLGEDSFFAVTAYNESSNIKTIPYIGYNWVQHPTSMSNTVQKRGIASPVPCLEALIGRNKELKNISKDCFEYFIIKFIVWNLYYICDDVRYSELKKLDKEYFNWLKEQYPEYEKNELVSFFKPDGEEVKVRILVFLFIKSPVWFRRTLLVILGIVKKIGKWK